MRLVSIQTDVAFNEPHANVRQARSLLKNAKDQGADLALLPEAFLTGYCVSTPEDAAQIALECHCDPASRDFDVTKADQPLLDIQALAIELDLHIVLGLAAKDPFGLFNAAVLYEPDGRMRRYVKTHLPCLGFDRFAQPGNALPVFQTALGCLGILVCYDLRPPEATRVLALKGAELVLLPTNWPVRPGPTPALMAPARAMENKVFFATCNRIGHENGFSFRGESAIYHCSGQTLTHAPEPRETILLADLDLAEAREKRTVVIPHHDPALAFETHAFQNRNPALYREITETH